MSFTRRAALFLVASCFFMPQHELLAQRPGEVNPYAGMIERLPVKLDDEVIIIGRSGFRDETVFGIVDRPTPWSNDADPQAPRITKRRSDWRPVAGAAGRIVGSTYEQAAFVRRTTPESGTPSFALEVVGLTDPGRDRIAKFPFKPPYPNKDIAVAVADVDAFEETTAGVAFDPPTGVTAAYHDEVVLAYHRPLNGERRAKIHVLSFEDVPFAQDREGALPRPTSNTRVNTSFEMLPYSRIVVRTGDNILPAQRGPHIVVAYLNLARQVVVEIFKYRHERPDPTVSNPRKDERSLEPVFQFVASSALSESAALAGGWDMIVGRGGQLGMDNPLNIVDVILVVSNDNGSYRQQG